MERREGHHAISLLLWALARFGPLDEVTRPGVRRLLRRTDSQLDRLVKRAESLRFVKPDGAAWTLTPAGAEFGAEMLEAVEESRAYGRRLYRPFFDYVPKRWAVGE